MIIKQDITFYLALWGALSSTILFVFQILKFRKEYSGKLKLISSVVDHEDTLNLLLANISHRPIVVLSYEILYAANQEFYQKILSESFKEPRKMVESETLLLSSNRVTLKENVIRQKIEQRYYHSLMLKLITSSNSNFYFDIDVSEFVNDPSIYKPAKKFVAADIFLGFQKLESKYYPLGTKTMLK